MSCAALLSSVILYHVLKRSSWSRFKAGIRVNWIVRYIKYKGIYLVDIATQVQWKVYILIYMVQGHKDIRCVKTIFISWHVILNVVFPFLLLCFYQNNCLQKAELLNIWTTSLVIRIRTVIHIFCFYTSFINSLIYLFVDAKQQKGFNYPHYYQLVLTSCRTWQNVFGSLRVPWL